MYINKATASRPHSIGGDIPKLLLHQGLRRFVGIDVGHPPGPSGFADRFELTSA